ncbi:MAG: hypothetical protein O3B87_05380 [bacterium]|nr:hypothetical protein [bacterium]
MKDVNEAHQMKARAIQLRQATLKVMYEEDKLEVNYNPTAGYIDIGHSDLNKFSTLIKYISDKYGVGRNEVCYVHIGDSSTDIIPIKNTGEGEPNEGADEAHLIGVANSNAKLADAIRKRGSHGMMTSRPSTLGARDFFKGLTRAISQ